MNKYLYNGNRAVPVAARSKAQVCDRWPAEIVGLNAAGGMDACCEGCLLSGRGLCDELITRPEESYECLSLVSVVCCQVEVCATG